MAEDQKREQLLRFLDRKAFDPVLNASESEYNPQQRERLADVQQATEAEKRRFHEKYQSAEEIHRQFRNDLSSQPAQRVHEQLADLDLPTLKTVEGEFEDLCRELGVGR